MGNALAEKVPVTILQLEARRQGYEEVQKRVWGQDPMPKVKAAMASRGDYISETLNFMHEVISTHDKLACATSSRINSEYCAGIFDAASKDPSLSEKQRDTARFLAGEFGKRAGEDVVFEKMYMANELLESGNLKEAAEIFKEIKPKMVEMADFYARDMEKKFGSEIASYVDPASKELIEWNTIKEDISLTGSILDAVERNFESAESKRFYGVVQRLAEVRNYEDELAIAYARKMGVFKERSQ